MQKKLQLLIELQEIEREIQALIEQKTRAPKQIAALKEEEENAAVRLDEAKETLDSVRKSRRLLEQEVEDLEGRAARSKQKLLGIKSNKEYQATLKEIEDIQKLIGWREDQIIEQMELADGLQKRVQEQQRTLDEARRRMKREGAQLEKESKRADSLIERLEEKQEQVKPQIPSDLLKKYQSLRANRAGVALAPVNKGTCQVCNMNLPPQIYNELQKDEEMLHCPSCRRIIYWVGHEAYHSPSQGLGGNE